MKQLSLDFDVSADGLPFDDVLRRLYQEFDRINADHFHGELRRPVIELSRRKTYGGYYQPHSHRIVIAWQAYLDHGWAEIVNTLRHEAAHIVHPNHSRNFWSVALKLGVTKRYAASPLKANKRRALFMYVCPACQNRVARRRRLRKASCSLCDKVYNPRFALRLVKE
jgi:predicted SprT family Zn-dependent metalloprotease